MSRPTRSVLRLARALPLAILLLSAFSPPAVAAETVQLEVRTMLAGRFEAGGWVAFAVDLANDGAPVSGYLTAESSDGVVRRFVELPAGSRKQVALYVRPEAFARNVTITFVNDAGNSLGSATGDVRVLERTTGHVAVVGDPNAMLRPQLISRATGLPDPILLTPRDFPERPEPLRGLETIVWAADSSGLGEAQRRSLERWVASGGQLVVLGGPDWQARVAAFAALLPVEGLRGADATPISPLARWVGVDPPTGVTTVTAALGTLSDGAIALARTSDGDLLASAIASGAGRITWIGVDLATEAFRAWAGAPQLWTRVIPDDRLLQQWGGGGIVDEEAASLLAQALSRLPSLDVPPAELLLAVIIGYILLIGPVSYLVLRRIDRRELAWVTAPLLVIVFSAMTWGIGISLKGSDVIVNQISVVRTTEDGSAAGVSTFAGVFSPTRATYDLTVRGEALLSGLLYGGMDPTFGGIATQYLTEQGDPAHLRGMAIGVFGLQAVRADAVVAYAPSLSVEWKAGLDGVEGRVTNVGEQTVEDVAIISGAGGLLVGTLEAGESKTFLFRYLNMTGSSASAQVYGQANWDPTTEGQRRVLIRSQVIDSLVGYGGWAGRPDGSPGIDRGPFVIGWHPDTTPLEVEVDGHEAQRYAQTVEVISGRPALGPGEVRLAASQLSTEPIELVGDATQNEPGYISLGNGEVTFRISLPLEASGIVPSQVTLIAGNDPGMIFYDQQNLGSLLPAGYRMAVYDGAAAEWLDVGDLSVKSRYEMEDPARFLDEAGRILVRISGSGIGDEVGQISVFASAVVEGIIP